MHGSIFPTDLRGTHAATCDRVVLVLRKVRFKHVHIFKQLTLIVECISYSQCARRWVDILVDVSEMCDVIIVTKKTKAPVDKREEKKDARDNFLF